MSKRPARLSIAALRRQEAGQLLPMTALMLVVLIGFAGLVIDVGRVWIAQRQLQNAVDAAAAVAGQDLPNSQTAYTDAVSFSGLNSGATGKNALVGYAVTSAPSQLSVTFKCLTAGSSGPSGIGSCDTDTSNDNCQPPGAQPPQPSGTTTCNVVTVSETATVGTTFAHLFLPNFTVSASATASARGGATKPLDVEVILDTTNSMQQDCISSVDGISGTPDKLDCAKAGVRALLQGLWPCSPSLSSCGTSTANGGGELGANVLNPIDEVGLMAFPALSSTSSRPYEINCSSDNFSVTYPNPPTGSQPGYDIVGLSSDYRPSVADTTLNWTTSNLVEAVDWGQCPGQPGNWTGDSNGSAIPSGTHYYNVSTSGSGSTSQTANTITLNQAETLTGLTFNTSGSGSGLTYTATVGTVSGSTWTAVPGLSCTSTGGAQCTASSSASEPAGTQLNLKVVSSGSGSTRSGTWTVNYAGPGMQYPGPGDLYGLEDIGGQGSYLAGAIAEAQYLLTHVPSSRTGANPVIIVLSDGELNPPKTFTDNTPCNTANNAATAAKNAGTTIYAIAYDSSGNCTDSSGHYHNVAGLQLMKDIASDSTTFFNQPNPGDLTGIFQHIVGQLTNPRLIG